MGWVSHNIDRIEEFVAERRMDAGWFEEDASNFDKHPLTDEEWTAAYLKLACPVED